MVDRDMRAMRVMSAQCASPAPRSRESASGGRLADLPLRKFSQQSAKVRGAQIGRAPYPGPQQNAPSALCRFPSPPFSAAGRRRPRAVAQPRLGACQRHVRDRGQRRLWHCGMPHAGLQLRTDRRRRLVRSAWTRRGRDLRVSRRRDRVDPEGVRASDAERLRGDLRGVNAERSGESPSSRPHLPWTAASALMWNGRLSGIALSVPVHYGRPLRSRTVSANIFLPKSFCLLLSTYGVKKTLPKSES